MSLVTINYAVLESTIDYSAKARDRIGDYISRLGTIINVPIGQLPGSDTFGYTQTAANLASQKATELYDSKPYFLNLEDSLRNVISVSRSVDESVAKNIETIAETYIGSRAWYEKVGDWIYDTFCVTVANHFSLIRDIADCVKWVLDKAGNIFDVIHDWFKYGDGKYIFQIAASVVGALAAIAGTVLAICSIPFGGPISVGAVIACVAAIASCVGTIITIVNTVATTRANIKALSLSGNIFDDDDGNPGAARYYGSAEKLSEMYQLYDYGGAEENAEKEAIGRRVDTTKAFADTVSFVCNIANLGVVRDYSISGPNNITGYRFTWSNIKANLLHDMGFVQGQGFKPSSFFPNLIQHDGASKYTLGSFTFSQNWINTFNGFKTADNVFTFIKNLDGIDNFSHDSDVTFKDGLKVIRNITGVLKPIQFSSPLDKYLGKGLKLITDYMNLAGD